MTNLKIATVDNEKYKTCIFRVTEPKLVVSHITFHIYQTNSFHAN